MIARGAAPERVHLFANTVDVDDFGARVDRTRRPAAGAARRARGEPEDVVVLSVARLGAGEAARRPRCAPSRQRTTRGCCSSSPATGPSGARLERLARPSSGVRLVLARRRRLGADRRAVRRSRRLRAALRTRAVGGRRQRGGGLRPAARPLGPRRRGARPPARRRERHARSGGRRGGGGARASRARGRSRAPPRPGRPLARAGARLGLRAERRGLPGRRPRSRRRIGS